MRPEAIAERLWPGRVTAVGELGGGITNHNFLIEAAGDRFVLRIGGKDTELLGIDRRAEIEASRMAAAIGVGPEVVTVVEPEGYLVTRFIEGTPISPERMRRPETIARAAASFAAIHAGPPIGSRFDAHRVVERYARAAAQRGVRPPPDYGWAKELAGRIEAGRGPQPLVPCHNDLLNANFIDDGERVRVVDWEYAGMGDRAFDLGNFSVKHDFDPDQDQTLLEAYGGPVDPRAVRLMRFMGAFFEAMWGVVQQAISELDFDYRAYAAENFERLHAIAAEPSFRAALATL